MVENPETTEEKVRKFALKYYPSAEDVEEEIKMGIKGIQLIEIECSYNKPQFHNKTWTFCADLYSSVLTYPRGEHTLAGKTDYHYFTKGYYC